MSVASAVDEPPGDLALLAARPPVPDHVVYRAFVDETVVLNLDTGRYHGLNAVGGRRGAPGACRSSSRLPAAG